MAPPSHGSALGAPGHAANDLVQESQLLILRLSIHSLQEQGAVILLEPAQLQGHGGLDGRAWAGSGNVGPEGRGCPGVVARWRSGAGH